MAIAAEGIKRHARNRLILGVVENGRQLGFRIAVDRIAARKSGNDREVGIRRTAGTADGIGCAICLNQAGIVATALAESTESPLTCNGEKPLAAQIKADIAGKIIGVAIAGVILPARRLDQPAAVIVLEDDVDHACDRVGAVLGGGAVLQHFDMVDGRDWNEVEICGGGTLELAGIDMQVCRAVAALAVHQHQRVVRRQAAKPRRQGQCAGVAAMRFSVEGRDILRQRLDQVGLTDLGQRIGAQDRDRGQRCPRRSDPTPACRSQSRPRCRPVRPPSQGSAAAGGKSQKGSPGQQGRALPHNRA